MPDTVKLTDVKKNHIIQTFRPRRTLNWGISLLSFRTMDTVATFYGVNFKLNNFFFKKHLLCRTYLYIRNCNKKRELPYLFCREKCFKSDFALTLLRKKSFSFFIGEQKYFGLLTLALHIVTPKKFSLFRYFFLKKAKANSDLKIFSQQNEYRTPVFIADSYV